MRANKNDFYHFHFEPNFFLFLVEWMLMDNNSKPVDGYHERAIFGSTRLRILFSLMMTRKTEDFEVTSTCFEEKKLNNTE